MHMVSADEAAGTFVKSGDTVFLQGAMNTPHLLISALATRAGPDISDVTTVSIHTEGENPLVAPDAGVRADREFRWRLHAFVS